MNATLLLVNRLQTRSSNSHVTMGDRWGTNTNTADERLSFTLLKSKSMSLKQANAKVKVKARARSDKQILQQMTSQLMSVPSFPPRGQTNQKPKKRSSSKEKQKEKQHQQQQLQPIRKSRTRALTPPPPPLSADSISSSKASNCPSESIGANSSRNLKSYNTSIRRGSNSSCSSSCCISDASNERQQHRAAAATHRRRRRRKRTIHWNKSVRVKVIHNVENYTRQEKKDTWYSADEYSLMEEECELTSTFMDKMYMDLQQLEVDSKPGTKARNALPARFSERGLESWTIRGEELKETRVQLVIETVWQSQIDAWALIDGAKLYSSKCYDSTIDDENEDDNNDKIHKDCWEYIRRESVKVSALSSMIAQELASKDEKAVLIYLKTVRSLEQSRKRIASMSLGGQRDLATTSNNERGEDCVVRTSSPNNNCTYYGDNNNSGDSIGGNNKKSILKRPKPTLINCESLRSLRKSRSCSPLSTAKAKGKMCSLSPPCNRIERPAIIQCQRERQREHQQHPKCSSSSSNMGKVGSDVNPRRPERFVSPTTPTKFLTGITLDDDLPPMALTTGGVDASPKTLALGKNDNSAHKSNNNDDDSDISSKNKKIRFQSNSKTKMIPGSNNTSGGINNNYDDTASSISDDDSLSIDGPGSVFGKSNNKKIYFIPKSKTKIPTSPVGSVCNSLRSNNASGTCSISNYNDAIGDEDSLNMQRRMMQSHMTMSVASEESSCIRRRIRRTAAINKDPS